MAKRSPPLKLVKSNKPHTPEKLLELYSLLLKPRVIEERMLLMLRQGRISKWFSGIGQEAIAVGAAAALEPDEFILPLHRNLGVFTTRNVDLRKLFAQFQGKESGFTNGRDRSFHFGTIDYHIVGMISHLGPQLTVADGIALAHKLRGQGKVTLTFTGEGGTSEGDFHEALNVASVWDLPVIFVIENNGYGLSTPVSEQYRCDHLSDRAFGYGIEGVRIDGNDFLKVYETIDTLAKSIRKSPRPVLVECETFRMRGHEEASGTKYVPKELFEKWAKKDPILLYEQYLKSEGLISDEDIAQLRSSMVAEVQAAFDDSVSQPDIVPDTRKELRDVYAPWKQVIHHPASKKTSNKRLIDAISDGLRLSLQKNPDLLVMGQDIAEYGGVFKITEGFLNEFGRNRIRNTPLCESAILGAGLGLSVAGIPSVIEMQFADFVSSGFNQIVNNFAKSNYRWGQKASVVVRMPTGGGSSAGPFHSQSNEAWFVHTPGLKVVYPAFPADAKGLLCAAIEDPNPVMFFEHKALYRSIKEDVPDDYYTVEIGKAHLVRQGSQVTIIAYGYSVHWALEILDKHPEVSATLIDLRTLVPLDYESIRQSVMSTGRVLIVHEDTLVGGIGGEIAAWIGQELFTHLDAPVMRCASLDTPVPFATKLEQNFFAKSRLEQTLLELMAY